MQWIYKLKKEVPQFLKKMKGEKVPGFFKYSLTGDIYDEQGRGGQVPTPILMKLKAAAKPHHENMVWGLGNTVFAVKIYYTIGLLDKLPETERKAVAQFIKSFQHQNGYFFDPLVKKKAWLYEKLECIKHRDFNNFFHMLTARGETRQAFSALALLGSSANYPYRDFPKTKKEVEAYLSKLNWNLPWGAGSHFAHLVFFLDRSDTENKKELIDTAISFVKKLEHEDGGWYKGNPSVQQKVNGAMKVLMGMATAGKIKIIYPKKLIDLCLYTDNSSHACDLFNVVYALRNIQTVENKYRSEEIKEAARRRLAQYKKHYFPEHGGFSFFPGRSNDRYYGARITRGLPEPDIHGTCLFLWGISIIAQILGIDKELGFKEYTP